MEKNKYSDFLKLNYIFYIVLSNQGYITILKLLLNLQKNYQLKKRTEDLMLSKK